MDELLEAHDSPITMAQLRDTRNALGLNPLDVAVRSGNSDSVTALLVAASCGSRNWALDLVLEPAGLPGDADQAAAWPSVTKYFQRLPRRGRAGRADRAASAMLQFNGVDASSPVGVAVQALLRSEGRSTTVLRALLQPTSDRRWGILSIAARHGLTDVIRVMLRYPKAARACPDMLDEVCSCALTPRSVPFPPSLRSCREPFSPDDRWN